MTTFSQMVDDLVIELLRPDMRSVIAGYLNQTIRDMHMNSETKMPVFYADNRVEDRLILSGIQDNTYLWDIPAPQRLQQMESVYYCARGVYAEKKDPSVARLTSHSNVNARYYWYRTGQKIAFSFPGVDGQYVDLSWFEYLRTLPYYPSALRPAVYNEETESFTFPAMVPPISQEEALNRTTNWMILKHKDVLMEGTRAKVYKRRSDTERAKMCYSQFETGRAGVIAAESTEFSPRYGR